jgi:hypothetical protein
MTKDEGKVAALKENYTSAKLEYAFWCNRNRRMRKLAEEKAAIEDHEVEDDKIEGI